MARYSDRARQSLLDSAEELFAIHGIDAVSNRRIVEHAGAANHSAISYHFGGRDGLLRALLERHAEAMGRRRKELLAALEPSPSVHDIIRARLVPLFELLDSLPRPSWRAQFLSQVQSVPSAVDIVTKVARDTGVPEDVKFVQRKVEGISDGVLQGRSYLMAHLVIRVCAEQEELMNKGEHRGNWMQVGRFLIDAAAGMLAAPVSDPEGELGAGTVPFL
ncbi:MULTISPECIES: TetR/AcrR family transcriptional regulator [Micrococcaceae]|uniref:TetR/AcrR family transcriptional regulator n=1 Tax=unclassified Kocuria TaxID=2649579 RepID=UPI00101385EB|nr:MULTISPECIES: helix-turn-helix domain-containing protein [unclassified Kocuria]